MHKLYLLLCLALDSYGMRIARVKRGTEGHVSGDESNRYEFPTVQPYPDNRFLPRRSLDENSDGYGGMSPFGHYDFHTGHLGSSHISEIEREFNGHKQITLGISAGAEKVIEPESFADENYQGKGGSSELQILHEDGGEHGTLDTHSIGDRGSYASLPFSTIRMGQVDSSNGHDTEPSGHGVYGVPSNGDDGKIHNHYDASYSSNYVAKEDVGGFDLTNNNKNGVYDENISEAKGENDRGVTQYSGQVDPEEEEEETYENRGIVENSSVLGGGWLHHYQHHEPHFHEVTKIIPVHKTISIPEPHRVQKPLSVPIPVRVIEPYPIKIPVPIPVEKIVHVPVEKIVKYSVVKPVPVKVEKKVPFPVLKPYPVPVPVYKLKIVIHSDESKHHE